MCGTFSVICCNMPSVTERAWCSVEKYSNSLGSAVTLGLNFQLQRQSTGYMHPHALDGQTGPVQSAANEIFINISFSLLLLTKYWQAFIVNNLHAVLTEVTSQLLYGNISCVKLPLWIFVWSGGKDFSG